ncbi:hypothetical protein [Sphingomonas bacterium]|uniref:hypothetical protein n=1 Tax=Sphingomonas bacterium TaxID=1895847 RepID=UPI0026267FEB|nr:hypothetical protein [Sphingomonas bacterium]MDB5679293.1 hypothetical protein [Sphingomonas bacterium]
MRKIALCVLAATVATPALAHDRYAPPSPREDLRDAARVLSDPRAQAGVAALVDSLTNAVMETRVGPLADLAPDSDIRRNDTLADIQARRDPAYRAKLRNGTVAAMAVAGRTARDAAAMSDEVDAAVLRLRRVIDAVDR